MTPLMRSLGCAAVLIVGMGGVGLAEASTDSGDRAIFEPLAPSRILDTRTGNGAPAGKIGTGVSIDVQITGRGGVPADATAVVLNLTATEGTEASYLTAWPTGSARPVASSLNVRAAEDLPNMVTLRLGTEGRVSIYNFRGSVHVIGDVAGYYRGHTHDDRYFTEAEVEALLHQAPQQLTPGTPFTLAAGECAVVRVYGLASQADAGRVVAFWFEDAVGDPPAGIGNEMVFRPATVYKTTGNSIANGEVCNTSATPTSVGADWLVASVIYMI